MKIIELCNKVIVAQIKKLFEARGMEQRRHSVGCIYMHDQVVRRVEEHAKDTKYEIRRG